VFVKEIADDVADFMVPRVWGLHRWLVAEVWLDSVILVYAEY